MLAVHRSYQLATVELGGGQHREFEFDAEHLRGLRHYGSSLVGQHGPSKNDVDLDLDLALCVLDDQLGVAGVLGRHLASSQTKLDEACGNGVQFAGNSYQSLFTSRLPGRKSYVDVHR